MNLTPNLALLLTYTTLALAQNLNISVPSSSQPLNLSSPAIPIDWSATTQYPELDIWFWGPSFGYSIAQNLSASNTHYSWDPHNVSAALQSTHTDLTETAAFFFRGLFHGVNSSAGLEVSSEQYRVTGYPYMSSAGALRPSFGGFGSVLLAAWIAFS